MAISISSATNPLQSALTSKGLSAAKAKLVEDDLKASVKAVATGGSKPGTAAVRAALDSRMKADIASGKLTQSDADAVDKTLDDMAAAGEGPDTTNATDGSTVSAGQTASGTTGGGAMGGAGGATQKTELYRTEVDAGAIATITITYTDSSTATETKASTGAKAAASAKTPQSQAYLSTSASKIVSGSLFDLAA